MDLVLQIIGGLFLFILLIIGFFVIRFFLRIKRAATLGKLADAVSPMHITVQPQTVAWHNADQIIRLSTTIETYGFKQLGTFLVAEVLDGVQLAAFTHDGYKMTMVLYENQQAGIWFESYVQYHNGETLTVSSTRHGSELEQPPGHDKIFLPQASVFQIIAHTMQERQRGPYNVPDTAEFPQLMEQAYAAEMAWRTDKGFINTEEMHRLAEQSGVKLSTDELSKAAEVLSVSAEQRHNEEAIVAFSEQTSLSVAEWEKVRDYLVVVHENMAGADIAEYFWDLEDIAPLSKKLTSSLEELEQKKPPLIDAFAQINTQLPKALRYHLLGTINKPLLAQFYEPSQQVKTANY